MGIKKRSSNLLIDSWQKMSTVSAIWTVASPEPCTAIEKNNFLSDCWLEFLMHQDIETEKFILNSITTSGGNPGGVLVEHLHELLNESQEELLKKKQQEFLKKPREELPKSSYNNLKKNPGYITEEIFKGILRKLSRELYGRLSRNLQGFKILW